MNKSKALLAGAAMVALSTPLAVKDAKAASATIAASAIVVDAIQLAAVQGIHFGTMSISGVGTITVSTGGVTNGGDLGIAALGASASERQGEFNLQADSRAVEFSGNLPVELTVGLDLDRVFLDGAGLATPITLTGAAAVAGTPIGVTSVAGVLNVGGRLSSTGAIAAGTHSGGFVLTASYQ